MGNFVPSSRTIQSESNKNSLKNIAVHCVWDISN